MNVIELKTKSIPLPIEKISVPLKNIPKKYNLIAETDNMMSWEVADVAPPRDRISKIQIDECVKRGLNVDKAREIYYYWKACFNRRDASKAIKKRGFSESTIGAIYAALNVAKY